MNGPAIKHNSRCWPLMACALAHAAFTFAYALTRLYTYKTSLLDLGTIDQVLWNLVHHGAPLSTTNEPFTDQNWFGFHFSPVLLLLVPFYAVWPHPELLQLTQSLAMGFAGVALFQALRAAGARKTQAWAGAILYWLNPFVLSAAVWDFHEIAFATLLIALALWALAARRFTPMCIALFFLLLTKEQYGLTVVGFGFLWGLNTREWWRGGTVMLSGLCALFVILKLIMPILYGAAEHPMFQNNGNYLSRFGWLSESWPQKLAIAQHLLFDLSPGNIPGVIYLILLLLTALLLPLFAPLWLAAGAGDFAANLLSASSMLRHVSAYHSAALIPALLFAAWQGYRFLESKAWIRRDLLYFTLALLFTFVPLFDYFYNPLSFWELRTPVLAFDRADVDAVKKILPQGPVGVQCNVGSFFSQREAIFAFPHETKRVNAVVLHLMNPYRDHEQNRFNNPFGELPGAFIPKLRAFLAEPGWHVAYWHAPWLVMERGASTQDEHATRAEIMKQVNAMGGR